MEKRFSFSGIPCFQSKAVPTNEVYFMTNEKLEIYRLIDFTNEISKLNKDLALAKEGLDSIASNHKKRHDSAEYWLNKTHKECAVVLATDTKIARSTLDELDKKERK